jgi:hypothetical protein
LSIDAVAREVIGGERPVSEVVISGIPVAETGAYFEADWGVGMDVPRSD